MDYYMYMYIWIIFYSCVCVIVNVQGTSTIYTYHNTLSTWSEARDLCKEDGFSLAEIHSEEEQKVVERVMGDGDPWIGGFVNYPYLSDTSAMCASISYDNNGIAVSTPPKHCKTHLLFICAGSNINDPYEYYTIRAVDQDGWEDARAYCFSRHRRIGTLLEYAESKVDRSMLNQDEPYWPIFSTWTWRNDSKITYFNWALTEPTEGLQKCLTISSEDGLWVDRQCREKRSYMCEQNRTDVVDVESQPIENTKNSPSKTGMIAGVTTAMILVVIGILVVVGLFLWYRHRQKTRSSQSYREYLKEKRGNSISPFQPQIGTSPTSTSSTIDQGSASAPYIGQGQTNPISYISSSHNIQQNVERFPVSATTYQPESTMAQQIKVNDCPPKPPPPSRESLNKSLAAIRNPPPKPPPPSRESLTRPTPPAGNLPPKPVPPVKPRPPSRDGLMLSTGVILRPTKPQPPPKIIENSTGLTVDSSHSRYSEA